MANRRNPEHFRAEFEFHIGRIFVSCTCGKTIKEPTLAEAVTALAQHHREVEPDTIYKEDK